MKVALRCKVRCLIYNNIYIAITLERLNNEAFKGNYNDSLLLPR